MILHRALKPYYLIIITVELFERRISLCSSGWFWSPLCAGIPGGDHQTPIDMWASFQCIDLCLAHQRPTPLITTALEQVLKSGSLKLSTLFFCEIILVRLSCGPFIHYDFKVRILVSIKTLVGIQVGCIENEEELGNTPLFTAFNAVPHNGFPAIKS